MSLLDKINANRAKLQRGNGPRAEKLGSERNVVRVLPSWDGTEDGDFHQEWGQHYIKGSDGVIKAVYVCTQTSFGEDCEICNAISKGLALTDDEDQIRTINESRSSKRILVNALYTKGGKHDKAETKSVVLDIPPTVFDSILTTASAFLAEGVNVFDPKEGHNFLIERTGTGKSTEYKVTPSPKASAIPAGVMDKIDNLNEWARQESEAEKAKALTTIRVITGQSSDATAPRLITNSAPRPSAPARSTSPLANTDIADAEFTEVPHVVKGDADSGLGAELDEFLNSLN